MRLQVLCESEDLIRAYTLVSDRIVTAESVTNQVNKLQQIIIRYVAGWYWVTRGNITFDFSSENTTGFHRFAQLVGLQDPVLLSWMAELVHVSCYQEWYPVCTREQGGVFRLVEHDSFVQSSSDSDNSLIINDGVSWTRPLPGDHGGFSVHLWSRIILLAEVPLGLADPKALFGRVSWGVFSRPVFLYVLWL